MIEELQPYRVQFTETWVRRLLTGWDKPSTVNADYLINDGRKRPRLWKELTDAGYIQDGVITSKAFDEYPSEKPDLESKLPRPENARRDQSFWEMRPGVPLDVLSTTERKYVVTHPAEYTFFNFNASWAHQGTQPVTFGAALTPGGRSHQSVWISDEAFTKFRTAAMYELRFYEMKRKNLAWALEELGVIEAADKDCFEVRSDQGFFHGGPTISFGNAPDAWEKDLDTNIETARTQIAEMTRKANVLIRAKAKIAEMWGWPKFHEAFDHLIHEYLQKKEKVE